MKNNIKIKFAKYIEDYKISFKFSNGKTTVVDFGYFILTNKSPYVTPYKNLNKFSKFKIINGLDISWNDYEMCFEIDDLYKGGVLEPISDKELQREVIKYHGKVMAKKMFSEAEMA